MKKFYGSICWILLFITVAFSGCGSLSDEDDTTDPAITYTPIKLCIYLYDNDGEHFSNAQITVNHSGEDFTYTADYLGYFEIPDLSEGEEIYITVTSKDGEQSAAETIIIDYGAEYSFDDKEDETETLTVPEGVNPVSVSFSVTEDGNLNCTSLS
ncbi:MAG: hypothetical protein LUG85_00190 [Clostridiales bacterium]|nr:hypothetical protein [Clostridiales bacterium]